MNFIVKNFCSIVLLVLFTILFQTSFQIKNSYSKQLPDLSKWRNIKDAQFYFLVDQDTHEVLLSKNPDKRIAPSSMTKLMTAYVIFDQIQKGEITPNEEYVVSKNAWRKPGSTMFLNHKDVVSVDKLLKGLLVVSGNDASIALAEASSGSQKSFVNLMNEKAKELSLNNSHFRNPHGLNEKGHYMSVRDLAILISRIYKDFPEYSEYLEMKKFTYGNITQRNRNPLIKRHYQGNHVGGKTGHTDDGGYGVTGAVQRGNRRLVAVVNKARTPSLRTTIITDLFDYGFSRYKKLTLFKKGSRVIRLRTWLGKKRIIPVTTNKNISVNIPKDSSSDIVKVEVKYKGPIYAPIKKGDRVATLLVNVKGYKTFQYPLFAKESVDKVGYLKRMNRVMRYKMRSFLNKVFH